VLAVRALAGRSARRRSGRYLVEGPQAVREAVTCAPALVRELYLSDEAADRYPEIESAALGANLPVRRGTAEVLAAMSGDAQGVVAVAVPDDRDLAGVLAAEPRLVAVLAHVRDPGNAGTVLRAADAAGADAVLLSDASVDVLAPKVVRAAAGSSFHLPVVPGLRLAETVAALRAAGLTVLAADGRGTLDLDDLLDGAVELGGGRRVDLAAPTAWLFGNEAWGLDEDALAGADAAVRVPIHGRAESLNLATAAAVCLYASARAQRRTR
jgi:TrmH family RNA methyltransferase